MQEVILVDDQDVIVGTASKLEAHREGWLHRAFSVFIFNDKGEWLIHQRADDKYHSAGLWSNTCCSHPSAGEETLLAANRRLQEEMGLTCDLFPLYSFQYRIQFDNQLIEHELDHVFVGQTNQVPTANPLEVKNWRYVAPDELLHEIHASPELFTYWFRLCVPVILEKLSNNFF
ncbi:MAG TPA: isopentenyl-diphosphate Delta-isomerase [Chitinophagaceae bacterium]|nr:isopentenyl-diphosphate Delta-isomerase [Chitinophagaceae bacterium]